MTLLANQGADKVLLIRSPTVINSLSVEEGCRVGNKRTLMMPGHTSSDPNTAGLNTCLSSNTHPHKYAQLGQQGVPDGRLIQQSVLLQENMQKSPPPHGSSDAGRISARKSLQQVTEFVHKRIG